MAGRRDRPIGERWNGVARGEGESSKARRGDDLEVTVLATDSSKGDNRQ